MFGAPYLRRFFIAIIAVIITATTPPKTLALVIVSVIVKRRPPKQVETNQRHDNRFLVYFDISVENWVSVLFVDRLGKFKGSYSLLFTMSMIIYLCLIRVNVYLTSFVSLSGINEYTSNNASCCFFCRVRSDIFIPCCCSCSSVWLTE